jgi:cytochrome c oxidase cbb3-type subunit III
MKLRRLGMAAAAALALLVAAACEADPRPARPLPPPPAGSIPDARQGALQAGPGRRQVELVNPFDGVAEAIQEGQRLYRWYNCGGCHGGFGGGGIGPPLLNGPRNAAADFDYVYAGRGGGMPAYGGRVPDEQIWKVVAYVHALNRREIPVPRVPDGPAPDDGSHLARGAP